MSLLLSILTVAFVEHLKFLKAFIRFYNPQLSLFFFFLFSTLPICCNSVSIVAVLIEKWVAVAYSISARRTLKAFLIKNGINVSLSRLVVEKGLSITTFCFSLNITILNLTKLILLLYSWRNCLSGWQGQHHWQIAKQTRLRVRIFRNAVSRLWRSQSGSDA